MKKEKKRFLNEFLHDYEDKNVPCSQKLSFRNFEGSFFDGLPNSLGPSKVLLFLYWFSQRIPLEQLMNYTGLKQKTAAKASMYVRKKLVEFMKELT